MDEKDIKEQLIRETKGSVFASLSFYLSAISDRFDNIATQSGEAAKAAEATYKLISSPALAGSQLQQYQLKEAVMEASRPNVSAAGEQAGTAIKRASLGVLQYAALLPLLLSKELRSKVATFFTSFLEGLGFDKIKNLGKKVKATVSLVTGALGVYFGLTALKRVADAINATINLASAIASALGIMEIFEKKRALEEAEIKKSAKAIRREKARVRLEKRQLRKAPWWKKALILAKRVLPKVVGKVVGAIPFVGTVAMIGLAMKDVFDEVTGFMSDDEEGASTAEDIEAEREVVAEDRPTPSITYNPEHQSEAETRRLMKSAEEVKDQSSSPSSIGNSIKDTINKVGESIGIKPPTTETGTEAGGEVIDDSMQTVPGAEPIVAAKATLVPAPTTGNQIEMASANVIGQKKQQSATNNYIIDNSVNNLILA